MNLNDWKLKWQPRTRGGFEVVDVRPYNYKYDGEDGWQFIIFRDGQFNEPLYCGQNGKYIDFCGQPPHPYDLLPVEQPAMDNITTPGQAAYEAFIAGCDWDGVAAAAVRAVGTAFATTQQPATRNDVGIDLNAKLHYLGAATWTHQQLDEIGKQASSTIASLTAERDGLRSAAINARAELQNHVRAVYYGGQDHHVMDCIAELDAAIAAINESEAK
jgi:hypothetical protein